MCNYCIFAKSTRMASIEVALVEIKRGEEERIPEDELIAKLKEGL